MVLQALVLLDKPVVEKDTSTVLIDLKIVGSKYVIVLLAIVLNNPNTMLVILLRDIGVKEDGKYN